MIIADQTLMIRCVVLTNTAVVHVDSCVNHIFCFEHSWKTSFNLSRMKWLWNPAQNTI